MLCRRTTFLCLSALLLLPKRPFVRYYIIILFTSSASVFDMEESLNNLRAFFFRSQPIIGLDSIIFSEVQNPAGQPLSGMCIFVDSCKV